MCRYLQLYIANVHKCVRRIKKLNEHIDGAQNALAHGEYMQISSKARAKSRKTKTFTGPYAKKLIMHRHFKVLHD